MRSEKIVKFSEDTLKILFLNFSKVSWLTLRRPNFLGAQPPVPPDLAKTVKVMSDHAENLAKVLGGAENGKFT